MAHSVSRKSTRKVVAKRRTAHAKCVSTAAKRMHKKSTTKRSHQLAVSRAQKSCAKKSHKGSRRGRKMHGFFSNMKKRLGFGKKTAPAPAEAQDNGAAESTGESQQ
jgi:hypothetical protein